MIQFLSGDTMQLKYHGIAYTPKLQKPEYILTMTGCYRSYHTTRPKPRLCTARQLIYRGVPYEIN